MYIYTCLNYMNAVLMKNASFFFFFSLLINGLVTLLFSCVCYLVVLDSFGSRESIKGNNFMYYGIVGTFVFFFFLNFHSLIKKYPPFFLMICHDSFSFGQCIAFSFGKSVGI